MSTVDQLWAEQMRAMERAQSEMAEMQRMVSAMAKLILRARPVLLCAAALPPLLPAH
jgi:type II secretory pathway component PulJ